MTPVSDKPSCWLWVGVAIVLSTTAGCTHQQLYDATRNWRIQECQKEVEDMEYESCMDRAMISYAEYERLRREETRTPQQDALDMLHWTLRQ